MSKVGNTLTGPAEKRGDYKEFKATIIPASFAAQDCRKISNKFISNMESIPTPPTTPGYGIQDTHQTLLHPLDVLLERYLNLLDSYQTSRLKLTEALSSVGYKHIYVAPTVLILTRKGVFLSRSSQLQVVG